MYPVENRKNNNSEDIMSSRNRYDDDEGYEERPRKNRRKRVMLPPLIHPEPEYEEEEAMPTTSPSGKRRLDQEVGQNEEVETIDLLSPEVMRRDLDNLIASFNDAVEKLNHVIDQSAGHQTRLDEIVQSHKALTDAPNQTIQQLQQFKDAQRNINQDNTKAIKELQELIASTRSIAEEAVSTANQAKESVTAMNSPVPVETTEETRKRIDREAAYWDQRTSGNPLSNSGFRLTRRQREHNNRSSFSLGSLLRSLNKKNTEGE
jgi:hypothetical protein